MNTESEKNEAGLLVSKSGDITRVVMSRPEVGNALSATLTAALHEAIETASSDGTRLFVLSGSGKHFCTGFDLSGLEQETDDTLLARFVRVELMLQALHAAPFVSVAIASGRAMGAGADLFAACTERWIVGDATLAFPGVAFGLALGTGRLADLVGRRRALEWLSAGAVISSDAAVSSGLASALVADTELQAQLEELEKRARRLDYPTQQRLLAASARRTEENDALDLQHLVRSAARPGIKQRISAYREATKRR